MSTVKANTFQDATGGSNAQLYGVASPPSSMGFRNRIINGAMVIDQRNVGASVPGPGVVYTVDRWVFLTQSASGNSAQQVSDAPTGFTNSLKITVGTGAAPTSTQQNIVWQPIEGFNVADFGLGAAGAATFTISFWVKSSIAGTYSAWLQNSASNRAYIATFAINSANTWEYKTITVAGDTSGTWLKTNGIGLLFGFSLGAGSTFQTTAGSWAAGDFKGAAGSVNLVATSGATFQITGVQLEAGSVASPFERRDYGRELIMCQRYCEGFGLSGSGADRDLCMGAGNGNSGNFQAFFPWKVQKRAAPTVSLAAASNFYVHVPGAFRVTCSSLSATDPTETGTHLAGVSSSGSFSAGQACFLAAVPTTAIIIASAEL